MKRRSTAAERRYMGQAQQLGCMLCRHLGHEGTPAEVHHARVTVGWGRDGHMNVIPLCVEHHRGSTGVHAMGRPHFAALHGISELELLAMTQREISGMEKAA